jgi:hypothetical protein
MCQARKNAARDGKAISDQPQIIFGLVDVLERNFFKYHSPSNALWFRRSISRRMPSGNPE